MAGGSRANTEHRHRRHPHVNLLLLPRVGEEGRVVNQPRGELESPRVTVDADGLETTVALLIVVHTLLCLGNGAVLHHVPEVVRGEQTVVARPLGGAGGGLVDDEEDGNGGRLAPPVGGGRPLDLLGDDLVILNTGNVTLIHHDKEVGEFGELADVL